MKERLLAFAKIYVLSLLLFVVQRPLLMAFSAALYAEGLPEGWAHTLWEGLPADLAVGGYLSLLPGVLLAVSALRRGTWLTWTMHVWFGLVALLTGFAFVLGLWFCEYVSLLPGKPALSTVLSLSDDALAEASGGLIVLGVLMILVCAALVYALYYALVLRGVERFTPPRRPWAAFTVTLLLAFVAFLPWVCGGQSLRLLQEWDAALLLAINGWHSPYADRFMYAYSGKVVWVPLYASLAYLLFRNLPWRTALLCLVGVALTITFADQVGASLVNGYRGGRYGFPSCHAANTFGLAFYLMFVFRQKGLTWLLMAWAVLTCYSRAYLGVHYPGDLLTGAALGLLGAALCYVLFRRVARYKRPGQVRQLWVPVAGGLTVAGMLVYAFIIY